MEINKNDNNTNNYYNSQTSDKYTNGNYTIEGNDDNYDDSIFEIEELDDNVLIDENVYNELESIHDISEKNDIDIPFYMLGFENQNGIINFGKIIVDRINNKDYNKLTPHLKDYIQTISQKDIELKGKPIICKGYASNKTELDKKTSINNIKEYMAFKEDVKNLAKQINRNELVHSRIDTAEMQINKNGGFDMLYFNNGNEDLVFYRFNNLNMKAGNGDIIPLSSLNNNNFMNQNYKDN